MSLLIGHLVDSRNLELAIDYIRKFVGDKNQHVFALCGRVHLSADEIPIELRNEPNFFVHINTSQFISDWVARIIKIASEMDFDFLQIRDWDDDYGKFKLPTFIPRNVEMICPNYGVKYKSNDVETTNVNPYGSFQLITVKSDGIDPRVGPYVIHRQFKFFSKKLVDKIAKVMWASDETYPKLVTLDDTLILPIAYIECYLNGYDILQGIDSDMKFVISDGSDTHKDSQSLRHSKALSSLSKVILFLSNYYDKELSKHLWIDKFLYKYLIDRGSKNLYSISFHEVSKVKG